MQNQDIPSSSRTYLSMGHLKNAASFARLTGEIEQHSDCVWGIFKPHEAYAMGSVLSAVAFLEATINEVYTDAADDSAPTPLLRSIGTGYAVEMPENLRRLLASLWNTKKFNMSARTLEKYQTALRLAGQEEFKKGAKPYQDVDLLIGLRNALVHYKPESYYQGESEPKELEKKLRGKFDLNPLVSDAWHVPFIPDRCLGYGCTVWAVSASAEFTEEFFSRIELKDGYGPWLGNMSIDYAAMMSLEKIAEKYGATAEHIVEHRFTK